MIPRAERKGLIDTSDGQFSISSQCWLLGINRSTLYYTPSTAREKDMELMSLIDEFYIEDPTHGTRRMSNCLKKRGYHVGRCKTSTLMRIKTFYCKARTTLIDQAVRFAENGNV